MMGHYYGNMFSLGLEGGFMMILLWAVIILIVVWLAREVNGKKDSGETKDSQSALDILRSRYAKGEMDKKEFEEKKKDLGY